MIAIGIDSGLDGAIVVLDGERNVLLASIVPTEKRASKRHYRLREMRALLVSAMEAAPGPPVLAVLERTQARGRGAGRIPMSASTVHSMGVGYGIWQGLLGGLQIPHETVLPSVWMKAMLHTVPGSGKERSILVAENTLPGLDLTPGRRRTNPHDGIADAAVLAIYGLRQMRGAL